VEIQLKGILIIVGNYGSGKTEVTINLAAERKRRGLTVRVADLDLVNFYFRTREAREYLAGLGIDLILPPARYVDADLPILSPAVAGMIRRPSDVTLLDVGGDDAGATVLASLADAFQGGSHRVLMVVNPLRPNTSTLAGCLKIMGEIESASGMRIEGIIGNANLMEDTTPKIIRDGYEFVSHLAEETGLPLEFVTVADHLRPGLDADGIGCPILTLSRRLLPPWMKRG
jgi:hypothetical protein